MWVSLIRRPSLPSLALPFAAVGAAAVAVLGRRMGAGRGLVATTSVGVLVAGTVWGTVVWRNLPAPVSQLESATEAVHAPALVTRDTRYGEAAVDDTNEWCFVPCRRYRRQNALTVPPTDAQREITRRLGAQGWRVERDGEGEALFYDGEEYVDLPAVRLRATKGKAGIDVAFATVRGVSVVRSVAESTGAARW